MIEASKFEQIYNLCSKLPSRWGVTLNFPNEMHNGYLRLHNAETLEFRGFDEPDELISNLIEIVNIKKQVWYIDGDMQVATHYLTESEAKELDNARPPEMPIFDSEFELLNYMMKYWFRKRMEHIRKECFANDDRCGLCNRSNCEECPCR